MIILELADAMGGKHGGSLAAVADMPVEEPGKIPEGDQRGRGGALRDERLVEGVNHSRSHALEEGCDVPHLGVHQVGG